MAHRNALRLLRLVNTLLDFSRIEAGRIDANYEPTDLPRLTAELASVFRSAIEKAGLQLVVQCDPLPEPVHVDREMWAKILLNLLSNALKFTFEGRITVALRGHADRIELRVSDTGVGIPEADLPRMFERFHRVKHGRARTHEGTGIGLAFVQELARLHGGGVTVASEEGRGTTFTVTIRSGTSHLPIERIGAVRPLSTSDSAIPYVEEALRWLPAADASIARGRHPPRSRMLTLRCLTPLRVSWSLTTTPTCGTICAAFSGTTITSTSLATAALPSNRSGATLPIWCSPTS